MPNLDRTLWFASNTASRDPRRPWRSAEVERLFALIGKRSLTEIANEMGRNRNSIASKLRQYGISIAKDVSLPLGLSAIGLARYIHAPYELVWRAVRAGRIRATREGNKDFRIAWPEVRRFQSHLDRIRRRRDRVLGRIKEPTITKQKFMALAGLSETHATRYMQGRIVKAYKIPCKWTDIGRERWEWLVSERDARRVARSRASGRLKLNTKLYRQYQKVNNAEITRLRRARRLGLRPARGPRSSVVPGGFSVPQIAQKVHLSETQVYQHVQKGRLKARWVRVGRRFFIVVLPETLPAYLEWCESEFKISGPLRPHGRQIEAIRRANRLTITDAAERYHLPRCSLAAAVFRGAVPCEKVDGMRALRARDVRRYARTFKPKKTS